MQTLSVGGTNLHYIAKGTGDPIVFVHGGLEDLRWWEPHVDHFATHHHAIAYSRRYNYPNKAGSFNPLHSAITEAEDLAALLTGLQLPPAHLVGASYGAYTALVLALRKPDGVRSLVLAEPALIHWLPELPDGQAAYDDFFERWWRPSAAAFQRGDVDGALKTTIDWWGSHGAAIQGEPLRWENLPEEYRQILRDNADDLAAMVRSENAFPGPTCDEVGRLQAPMLMLSGTRTIRVHHLIDAELARILPNAPRVAIDAGHDMWGEQPDECRQRTGDFIRTH
jgi:pimeloyl-ACP methyl ester carboxylesterase